MSVPKHLALGIDGLDFKSLLLDWGNLVPADCKPIMMTALGDVFFSDINGCVHFLDVLGGRFSQVAISQEEFAALCEDRKQRRIWFAGFLVMELRKLHGELPAGKCFSCDVPLWLGGKLEKENFHPTDVQVHFSVMGQLYQQTKDLPPGTKIAGFKTRDQI